MGSQAEDVFLTPRLESDKKDKYDEVIKAFDNHFMSRRNIIYERSIFNQRIPQEGETADEFITSLHVLAERCEYGQLKDDLIRDIIVVGIRDKGLMEKLQLRNDLTLSIAMMMVRQSEQVQQQTTNINKSKLQDRYQSSNLSEG